jgi:hypothetical protein
VLPEALHGIAAHGAGAAAAQGGVMTKPIRKNLRNGMTAPEISARSPGSAALSRVHLCTKLH